MTPLVTIKTSDDARRLLRIVAAMTGEKQFEVLERLLRAEEIRLREQPQ
jgi:hypothetical protein